MFYMQYLSSLCHRRQWPEPLYESYRTRSGVKCVVRVNNREYHTDATYANDMLASENAAMRAYLICRNFSVNDGMYPAGHQRSAGSVLQGMPVAIGRERRSGAYSSDDADGSSSSGSRSGGSSPGSDRFPTSYLTGGVRGRHHDVARVLNYGSSHRRH